jgi:phage-related minor tail protein
VVGIALAVAAIGPLLFAVGKFMTLIPTIIRGFQAMKGAMAALSGPMGLLVLAIAAIVTAWITYKNKTKEATEQQQLFNESIKDS